MLHRLFRSLFCIILLPVAFCLTERSTHADVAPAQKTSMLHWEAGFGGIQLVKVVVNDKQTAVFIFDSGTSVSFISDTLVSKLKPKPKAFSPQSFMGKPISLVTLSSLAVGDVHILNSPFGVMAKEQLKGLGQSIDGILGANVLKVCPALFDFQQHQITLFQRSPTSSDLQQVNMDGAIAVDVEDGDTGTPDWCFPVKIVNGETVIDVKMYADTGANNTHVSSMLADKLGLKPVSRSPVITLFGTESINDALISSLSFDTITAQNLNVVYMDKAGYDDDNQIGLDVLSHFRVLFDYPSHKIYFKFVPVAAQAHLPQASQSAAQHALPLTPPVP